MTDPAPAAQAAAPSLAQRPSPEAPVRVLVELLSGRRLEIDARPSDTVGAVEDAVEQQLGLELLHEARLVVDEEHLGRDLTVGQLAEQQGGPPVSAQAVLAKSERKATAAVESEEFSSLCAARGRDISEEPLRRTIAPLVTKYTPVLEFMIESHLVHARVPRVSCSRGGYPEAPAFCRFAAMCSRLRWMKAGDSMEGMYWLFRDIQWLNWREGQIPTWQSTHEELNECVIAAIEDPSCHGQIELHWQYSVKCSDSFGIEAWHPTLPRDAPGLLVAFDFLAQLHPQAAVRAAAGRQLRAAAPPPASAAAPALDTARGRRAPGAEAADGPAGPSDEREVEEIAEALRRSDLDAVAREGEEVSEAVLRSKADRWSADGVVLARLNKHTPEILETLRRSELLAPCRARAAAAGCEPSPPWAGGALLLVPATEGQIAEAGMQLKAHHILMLSVDMDLVERALSELPCRRRPKVRPERFPEGPAGDAGPAAGAEGPEADEGVPHGRAPAPAEAEPTGLESASDGRASVAAASSHRASDEAAVAPGSSAPACQSTGHVEILIEKTFVHFPLPKDISEVASAVTESAPARLCDRDTRAGEAQGQPNPRRWQSREQRR